MAETEKTQPVWMRLTPTQIAVLDQWADSEKRSRAAQMELIIENALEAYSKVISPNGKREKKAA